MDHRAIDPVTLLTSHRPLGARAVALDMAEQARLAVAAGAKVTRYTPPELSAHHEELARKFAERSARAKARIRPSTRAACATAGRRKGDG